MSNAPRPGTTSRTRSTRSPRVSPGPEPHDPLSPSNVAEGARTHKHRTTSPTGITRVLYLSPPESGPTRVPTTLRSAVPAPHTCRSGVYTHKQLGGGGDASLLGVGDTQGAASHPSPLHTAPSPCSRLPPNPNPANSRKPNSQRRPDDRLGAPAGLLTSKERHTQLRRAVPGTPPPEALRFRHKALGGPRPPPQTEPPPPAHPPPQLPSGTVTCSSSRRTRAGAHPAPVRVSRHRQPSFSEPVNLTPAPPGGSKPQAQLHRGDSNDNNIVQKSQRNHHRGGCPKLRPQWIHRSRFPPLFPSPAPPAARGLTVDWAKVQPV